MKFPSKIKFLSIFITLFLSLFFHSVANSFDQKPLLESEIDKFIHDTPSFINHVKARNLDGHLVRLFLFPDQVNNDLPIKGILIDLNWIPERYAYIFSHVIIGGFIRDMGEFGEGKLSFLKEQRMKWIESDEPEPEKSIAINELEKSITDLSEIVERTKTIPKSELLLLWSKRDALNEILMGKMPIGKKRMRILR
jgi:hypothetical protein